MKPFNGKLDEPVRKPFTGTLDGAPEGRTASEVVGDTARGVLSGGIGLVKTAGDLAALSGLAAPDNIVSELAGNAQKYYTEGDEIGQGQSDYLKEQRRQQQAAIDAEDTQLGKAGAAIKSTLTNPALLGDMAAQNVASLVPALGAGRLAAGAATKLGAGAATAGNVGLQAAVGTGAVQQATDVSTGAYEAAMAQPQETWDTNPEYVQRVAAGQNPDQVKQELAMSSARAAFVPAAGISVASQFVPGGQAIERALVGGAAKAATLGGAKGAALGAIKGAGGEALSEAIEEGGGQVAANLGVQAYADQNRSTFEDVGQNTALGAIGGGLFGGALGGVAGITPSAHPAANAGEQAAVPPSQVPTQQPVAPPPQQSSLPLAPAPSATPTAPVQAQGASKTPAVQIDPNAGTLSRGLVQMATGQDIAPAAIPIPPPPVDPKAKGGDAPKGNDWVPQDESEWRSEPGFDDEQALARQQAIAEERTNAQADADFRAFNRIAQKAPSQPAQTEYSAPSAAVPNVAATTPGEDNAQQEAVKLNSQEQTSTITSDSATTQSAGEELSTNEGLSGQVKPPVSTSVEPAQGNESDGQIVAGSALQPDAISSAVDAPASVAPVTSESNTLPTSSGGIPSDFAPINAQTETQPSDANQATVLGAANDGQTITPNTPAVTKVGKKRLTEQQSKEVDALFKGDSSLLHANNATLLDRIRSGNMPKNKRELRNIITERQGRPPEGTELKDAQEELEVAISTAAAEIAQNAKDDKSAFDDLRKLYDSQPRLEERTSSSIENQAYSTPAPLAFVASRLAGIDKTKAVYEPTAGNGMLLLSANPEMSAANELQENRFQALGKRGFKATKLDATKAIGSAVAEKSQDAVIMNPPFGSIKDEAGKTQRASVDGYKIGQIDHLIAAESLRAMKDDGKAVLIIGANKVAGQLSQNDRIFFNWLYSRYNVTGQIEIDGKLYARQGAQWPVRLIVINGRKESKNVSPVAGTVQRFNTWESIYEQYQLLLDAKNVTGGSSASVVGENQRSTTNDVGRPQRPASVATDKDNRSDGGKQRAQADKPVATPTNPSIGVPKTVPGESGNADSGLRTDDAPAKPDRVGEGAKPSDAKSNSGTDVQRTEPRKAAGKPAGAVDDAAKEDLGDEYQSTYQSESSDESGEKIDDVLVPVNMADSLKKALKELSKNVGGSINEYARKELGYASVAQMKKGLAGLQIDAIAAAIYQMSNGKEVIIADQTGIGKGRQAAAILRWAMKKGHIPVFVTVKPELFTDMYNDLADIGTHDLKPLLVNDGASIVAKDGTKLFANKTVGGKSEIKKVIKAVIESEELPADRNAVFFTYSQIQQPNDQRTMIRAMADRAVFVLDESHNAAGESATSTFVKSILKQSEGATHLSATYAKRPDNMALYSGTDIGDAIAGDEMTGVMSMGGAVLQTIISNNLVKAGQLWRRERSFKGIEINSLVDTANKAKHEAISDRITNALRAILAADRAMADHADLLQQQANKEGQKVGYDQTKFRVDHSSFSSVVHNVVSQMLLGIRSEKAADMAIEAIKRGEKPVIALESTMGSFLEGYVKDGNLKTGDDLGSYSYRDVLTRALDKTRWIKETDQQGNEKKRQIPIEELGADARKRYDQAAGIINKLPDEIPVSPIDYMRQRIEDAGHTVAEITGRTLRVDYSAGSAKLAVIPEKKSDRVTTIKRFNGDAKSPLDALIINVAGSTGISLHASEKFGDQRKREMIIAQAPLDINILTQLLGRINRTGQVVKPTYRFLAADLPSEKRPMAVRNRKLKSLNANVSSNTDSAVTSKDMDILNVYGDKVVTDYLAENYELENALHVTKETPDAARVATGRLAVMPVETQNEFYDVVERRYSEMIDYVNETGQNKLESKTYDYAAQLVESKVIHEATGDGPFKEEAVYGEYKIKPQGVKMTPAELVEKINKSLDGKTPQQHNQAMMQRLSEIVNQQKEAGRDVSGYKVDEGFVREMQIGQMIKLDLNGDLYNGIITNVRNNHKGDGNPFALSNFNYAVAVNGPLRSVNLPGSELKTAQTINAGNYEGRASQLENFFRADIAGATTAKIITKNVLAAYAKLRNSEGTIISFTDSKGDVQQGILLPKKFELEKNINSDVQFKTGAELQAFFAATDNPDVTKFGVSSKGGVVQFRKSSDSTFELLVPKSKASGGKFFLNKEIIEITGDFFTAGNFMKANGKIKDLAKVADIVMGETSIFAPESMAAGIKSANSSKKPVKFSKQKNTAPGQAMNSAAVESVIAPIISKWDGKNAPKVIVVDQTEDLPTKVRNARGFDGKVEAAVSGNTIYLVANKFTARARVLDVLAHEAVGHYGVETILGKEQFAQVAAQVVELRDDGKMPELFGEIKDRYGDLDDLTLASEAIAVMAEKGMKNGIMGRVMAAIRKFIRALGFELDLNENDLRDLIVRASRFLDGAGGVEGVKFSKEDDVTDSHVAYADEIPFDEAMWAELTGSLRKGAEADARATWDTLGTNSPAFKRWFGNSKAAKNGKPIELYHGTSGNFFVFNRADGTSSGQPASGLGVFTTTDPDTAEKYGDRVMQLYARIENPYRMSQSEISAIESFDAAVTRRRELQARGHDGIYVPAMDAWVAFSPKQLKSATDNNGSFSTTSADIRFSKMPAENRLKSIGDAFETAVKGMPIATAKDWAANKFEDWRPKWLAAFTLRQMATMFKPYLPQVETYVDALTAMNTRRNVLRDSTAKTTEKWEQMQRANRKAGAEMARLMHDSTLAAVDGDGEYTPLIARLSDGTAVAMNEISVGAATHRLNELLAIEDKGIIPDTARQRIADDITLIKEMLKTEKARESEYPVLQARFNALPEDFKELYREVRQEYQDRNEEYFNAIFARVGDMTISSEKKAELQFRMRAQFENNKAQGPYFPLARFGDYTIAASKPAGDEVERVFELAESQTQQLEIAKKLKANGYEVKLGRRIENAKAIDGASGSFVSEAINLMAAEGVHESIQDSIYQLYLRSLPDLSIRKNFIHRKGVKGYSEDALRAFAGAMDHGAYQLARLEHMPQLDAAMKQTKDQANELRADTDLGNKASAVYNELAKRHEFVLNPKNAAWVNTLSSANFIFYLGVSPAAAMVNLTQNAIITFPTMAAKFGYRAASRELFSTMSKASLLTAKAVGNWLSGKEGAQVGDAFAKTLSGEDAEAYTALSRMGAIDTTQAHDQAGIADGATDEYNWKARKAMRWVSSLFHAAEVINRESAGIAAFRLARSSGSNFQDAVKYAADIIHSTHYDYTNTNRARIMQGDFQKILFAFKQYSQNTTFFLWRAAYESMKGASPQERKEAQKRLAGVLGMAAVFSGSLGLPAMGLMFGTMNAIANAFGDDDEPFDAETAYRNFLSDYLGDSLGGIAQNGLIQGGIEALGLPAPAIADRTKLDQLWFRAPDEELTYGELGRYVWEQIGGPVVGMGLSAMRGFGQMADGNLWRGVETMTPKFIRDVMKSARFATQGVNTADGEPLIEGSGVGTGILQAFGFSSAEVSEMYNRKAAIRSFETEIFKRRDALLDSYALMLDHGDEDGIKASILKIIAFNRKHPTVAINAASIRSSLKGRARFANEFKDGIRLNQKLKGETLDAVRF